MNELAGILEQLHASLADIAGDDFDALESILFGLEDVLGSCGKLHEHDQGELSTLSPESQRFLHSLVYVQSVWHLFGDNASDGFLSVFYNWTGRDIDVLRDALKRERDPLQPLVEEGYALAAPAFNIVPDTNWVTRRQGADVFETIGPGSLARFEALDRSLEAMQDDAYPRLLAAFHKALSDFSTARDDTGG